MKIVVFLIAALIQLVFAAFGFFILLVGLNGFSGKQAEPALAFYMVLALASVLGLGAASCFAAQKLTSKTSLGKFLSAAITVVAASIIGVGILTAGIFVAALLAEVLRK